MKKTVEWDVVEFEHHANGRDGINFIEKGVVGTIKLPDVPEMKSEDVLRRMQREGFISKSQDLQDYDVMSDADDHVVFIDHAPIQLSAFELRRKEEVQNARKNGKGTRV